MAIRKVKSEAKSKVKARTKGKVKRVYSDCRLLNVKLTDKPGRDRGIYQARAKRYTEGNMSAWIRAISKVTPTRTQLRFIRSQLSPS